MNVTTLNRRAHAIPSALRHKEASGPGRLFQWLDRRRQRRRLAQLEQRLLDDIGVSRADAIAEARRWS